MASIRPFCLAPRRLPRDVLARISSVQPVLNKLYDAVSKAEDFIADALGETATACAWGARELEAFRSSAPWQAEKPKLLLPNAVYLHGDDQGASSHHPLTLTVGNVQAGEPYQLELVHNLHSTERPDVLPGPMHAACEAIAAVARLVHPVEQCVAILTKPLGTLALRTRIDVRGVGVALQKVHGVSTVIYVSMADLAQGELDANGDLLVGGTRISVIYSRYDFSHPTGAFLSPREYKEQLSEAMRSEWRTIEMIERSNAVMSSSLGARLANRRSIIRALTVEAGAMERFVEPEEAAMLRDVLPMPWDLLDGEQREILRERVTMSAPAGGVQHESGPRFGRAPVVAKNLLRPRTGSGKTQDRKDSNGMLIEDREELLRLLDDEKRRRFYVAYERVTPAVEDAAVVVDGNTLVIDEALSEVAAYGVFAADASGRVLVNAHAGCGARIRPADPHHPLAAALGYGALSTCRAG